MPRKVIARQGPTFHMVEYDLPALGADEVRVSIDFAAPKHGTEMKILTANPLTGKRWDPTMRIYLPADAVPFASPPGDRNVGNMVVGTVTAIGEAIGRYNVGDRVFGYGPICEVHQAPEERWYPLGDLNPSDAVAVDPAHVAFVAVRDGNIRIGDDVAVYGLGAIGLMAIQIARAAGAHQVFGVDPLPNRRAFAEAHGADRAFDPRNCDAGLEIKLATDKKGVDVSLETSGNGRALHDAIRCIRQCGTVVNVAFGPHDNTHLHLDEEFHINRPVLIGTQAWAGWENPDRDYPLWTHERAYGATIQLFRKGLVTGEGLISPIVPFDEAPDRLGEILDAPEKNIKMGVHVGAYSSNSITGSS